MERYQRIGVLGRGAFATVVLVRLRQPSQQEDIAASGALESQHLGTGPLSPGSLCQRRSGSGDRGRPRVESEDLALTATPSAASTASAGAAGQLRVIKEVDLRGDERRRSEALREAEVLKALSHPNIIAYHEALVVDTQLCIVMEYADGGDLAGAIARRRAASRRFLEREAMAAFVQLGIAVQYIHERRILHRDLKSKNAFLTRGGVLKLGDFGIAKVFDATDSFTETQVGTPYYLPPEMCTNQPYAYPADIWCLGIVLYELLALEVPFSAPSVPALAHKICSAEPPPVQGPYSGETRALLASLLAKRPEQRPTSTEVLQLPHVRRSAAVLLAAAAAPQPSGGSPAVPAPEAPRAAAAVRPAADADLDFDLEALLGESGEDGLPSLAADAPEQPRLSPTGGAEAIKFQSSLQQVLDSTMSCDRLLHELEQELSMS